MTITVIKPKVELITPVEHLVDYTKLLEKAGRTCYKSEERITGESANKFIRGIVRRGHESVIEHCSITYRFICSRVCSHQLVRHRLAAYSQESQRYCDYGKLGFQVIMPPSIEAADSFIKTRFLNNCEESYATYLYLSSSGVPVEDARFALPNAAKTEVVATYNLRTWRHVIKERFLNPHAQWEIKSLFQAILYELNHYLPVIFEDLVAKIPKETGWEI